MHEASASTRESEIYEGETFSVSDGGAIEIFVHNFMFTVDGNGTKVLIDDTLSDAYVIVPKDGCDTIGHFNLCFDRVSGNAIFVRIFSQIPLVNLRQNVLKEEFHVGEPNTISVAIENSGAAVSNVTSYTFEVPDWMKIISVSGADLVDDEIYWEGRIPASGNVNISFDFLVYSAEEEMELTSVLEYNDYFEDLVYDYSTTVTSISIFDVLHNPKQIMLGDKVELDITLRNTNYASQTNQDEGNPVHFDRLDLLKDNLPKISRNSGFTVEKAHDLFWSGILPFNKTKEFSISFSPTEAGFVEVPFEIKFNDTASGKVYEMSQKLHVEVLSKDIGVHTTVEDDSEFNASQTHHFDVILSNIGDNVVFRNITVVARNEFGEDEKTLEELGIDSQRTLRDLSFVAPPVASRTSDSLTIDIFYTNDFGENKKLTETLDFFVVPVDELVFSHNITELSKETESYRLHVFAENLGLFDADNVSVSLTLPEELFFKGILESNGTLLESGASEEIFHIDITTSSLNFSEKDFLFGARYEYSMNNITRLSSEELSLNDLVFSLYDDPSFFDRTQEEVERIFSSVGVFAMFIAAILILFVAVGSLFMYRKQFTISGYDSLEKKQMWIEKTKKKYDQRERKLKTAKNALDAKMRDLKDFMSKTKNRMTSEFPVIEEKKDGLKTRQEELLKEKELIDRKIEELKEIEERLLKRNYTYEKEMKELELREKQLNERFKDVKSNLNSLTNNMQHLLNEEDKLSEKKESLNKKELGIIAEKQKLIKMGSEKFSEEKIDVIQEKVKLEHEINSVEEELFSLKNRKKDIVDAQDSIQKEKANMEKEKNLFDANKDAVESSLKVLQEQSGKLRSILKESHESFIKSENDMKSETEKESKSNKEGKEDTMGGDGKSTADKGNQKPDKQEKE
ncbi:MAG: hypothetical protein ACOCUR_01285 [Nanoarchaeota archaeon]